MLSGPCAGKTLKELYDTVPELFGEKVKEFPIFPLLIKLIDAKENLSVQVHPTDLYALTHDASLGKSEVWYVAEAKEDAALYCGFEREVTREEVVNALKDHSLEKLLHRQPVKAGDAVFVRAGTVHAILGGVTVFEVQENSNITYRLYDYGRIGADGKPRELHIDKALEVLDLTPAKCASAIDTKIYEGYSKKQIAKCRYFSVSDYEIRVAAELGQDCCFGTFTVLHGNLKANELQLKKGDTVMIPAGERLLVAGSARLLYTTIE